MKSLIKLAQNFLIPLMLVFCIPTFGDDEVWGEREPSSVMTPAGRRAYPGGSDEEDLRVQAQLPEAQVKLDTRTLQREVYKNLYNQELKDERHDPVEE